MAEINSNKHSPEGFDHSCNDQNQTKKVDNLENIQDTHDRDYNDYAYHDRKAVENVVNGTTDLSERENSKCCDVESFDNHPELHNGCSEVICLRKENKLEEKFSNGLTTSPEGCSVLHRADGLFTDEDGGDKDYGKVLQQNTSSEIIHHLLETEGNHGNTSRQKVIDEVGLIHSKLQQLVLAVNQIAANDGQEDFTTVVANYQQELQQISARFGNMVPDLVRTKSKNTEIEVLDKTKGSTSGEKAVLNEDYVFKWRQESQLLQARVEEVLLENRRLKVEVKSTEHLAAASRELKRENENLLGEYCNFKQYMLNTRCQECLKLVDRNEMCTSLISTRFEEKWHVEGAIKGYMACRESRQTTSSGLLHGKQQSVSALTKMFESRLQGCSKQHAEYDREKARTKSEGETKCTSISEAAWEYSKTGAQPSYHKPSEEILTSLAIVQRNLDHNEEFRQEADRLMTENEKVVHMFVDLQTKVSLKTDEVAPLKCKLVDLERQLVKQIEDLNLALSSIVKKNDTYRRRLVDGGNFQITTSSGSQLSDVAWQIGNGGVFSVSEISVEFPLHYLSNSDDDHANLASCRNAHCEVVPLTSSDLKNGSPVDCEDCIFLSKHYVEDLLAEITALKRTVEEQSRYLQSDEDESTVVTEMSLANGESLSTRLPGKDICHEKWTNIYHTASKMELNKPMTSIQPTALNVNRHNRKTSENHSQEDQEEFRPSIHDKNGVINQEKRRNIDSTLIQFSGTDDHNFLEMAKDTAKALAYNNSDKSLKYGDASPCCSSHKQNMSPVINQVALAWPMQHRSFFDDVYKATFRNSKVLCMGSGVLRMDSLLKPSFSEGDIYALNFAGEYDDLSTAVPVRFSKNQSSVNLCEQVCSHKELLRQKHSPQKANAFIQTDEMRDFGTRPNSDAEMVKKYNAVLANLRKTCDLVNAFHPSEGNYRHLPEISEEDYLSVDELLLLINSYEQLSNEKKILEDENRVFSMELDELASRLIKAEERGDERSLPSISEENFQEQLAEMEDQLDAKQAELSELQRALSEKYENEKIPWKKFKALRDSDQITKKMNDMMDKNVELIECQEAADCTGRNYSFIQQTDPSVISDAINNLKNELHGKLTRHQQHGCSSECGDELKLELPEEGKVVLCSEEIVMNSNDAVHLNDKSLKAELCHVDQDPSKIVASFQLKNKQLEVENRRLKEEVEKWKRLKQFPVDDAESMFCVQERLASENEQLSRKLESTSSKLATRDAAYRQLETAYHHLELEKDLTINVDRGDDGERVTESITVDVDVMQKVVEKVCLLQATNSNLVEETVKLALQLEREDLKFHPTKENVDSSVADKEMTDYYECSAKISRQQPQHDFPTAWRVTENGANKNSAKANEQQDMITQAVVLEATQQTFETINGGSELQSRSTEVTQAATDAAIDGSFAKPAEDGETTHFSVVNGTANRPLARDLVCSTVDSSLLVQVEQ